jgi:phosphatidylethanolamine-binding protein (PEBP) family uncharacterized protein
MVGKLLRGIRAGDRRSRLGGPGLDAPMTICVTSPAFADGAAIPAKHAGKGCGDNISPALSWIGLPSETQQLAMVIEDIDVPLPRPILHTIALAERDLDGVDEGALQPCTPGLRFIPTILPGLGYFGPTPIPSHGAHRYRFHLLALDTRVPDSIARPNALFHAMRSHVAARGLLTGTYQR